MKAPSPILTLTPAGPHRYEVGRPDELPEGRDVVFSGQLLGQMILASDIEAAGRKDVRSVHAVFARAGSYSSPIEMTVESMQSGRTWGSDTVTATQAGRLLSRGLVLLNTVDSDLMRHGPPAPAAAGRPEDCEGAPGQIFPGADWRPVPGAQERDGIPVAMAWHRYEGPLDGNAAHQAVLAWATCGEVIGLAMRPHPDEVSLADAHRTVSTGVIAHTVHFLERCDVSRWLLVVTEGTSAANGRVYGGGSVFDEGGRLIAVFHQDSMAKAMDAPAPPGRSL